MPDGEERETAMPFTVDVFIDQSPTSTNKTNKLPSPPKMASSLGLLQKPRGSIVTRLPSLYDHQNTTQETGPQQQAERKMQQEAFETQARECSEWATLRAQIQTTGHELGAGGSDVFVVGDEVVVVGGRGGNVIIGDYSNTAMPTPEERAEEVRRQTAAKLAQQLSFKRTTNERVAAVFARRQANMDAQERQRAHEARVRQRRERAWFRAYEQREAQQQLDHTERERVRLQRRLNASNRYQITAASTNVALRARTDRVENARERKAGTYVRFSNGCITLIRVLFKRSYHSQSYTERHSYTHTTYTLSHTQLIHTYNLHTHTRTLSHTHTLLYYNTRAAVQTDKLTVSRLDAAATQRRMKAAAAAEKREKKAFSDRRQESATRRSQQQRAVVADEKAARVGSITCYRFCQLITLVQSLVIASVN
jgi:hypothetical protein